MSSRRLPSLSALQAFESFARNGRMTAAAEELGVTHGAISRSIRALEHQIGSKLIGGPRHRIALTDYGERLAAAASAAFGMIEKALPATARNQAFVLSCSSTFAMKWLIPRLPLFLTKHPEANIQIVSDVGEVDFGARGVDAAIRFEDAAPRSGRRTVFLRHFHGPVLSPSLWEACGRDGARILSAPRLSSTTYPNGWSIWAERAKVNLAAASGERRFEHNTYMLEAAAAGLGVAVAPWAFTEADIKTGRLIAPLGFAELPHRFVFVRPEVGEHAIAETFGAWLRRQGQLSMKPN